MIGGDFGQQSIIIADDPCSYHSHAFAFADKARLGPNFTAALISQQVCIQINSQWESLAFFSELRVTDGKHGRRREGLICQRLPNGGLGLHCREGGLEDAADDQAVGLASGDREAHSATLPGRRGRSATVLGFAPRSQRSLR